MGYVKIILNLLASLFRWKANATDPQVVRDKQLKEWQDEVDRLGRETNAAREAYEVAVASGHAGDDTAGRLMQLHLLWARAADAEHRCRARRPKSATGGP